MKTCFRCGLRLPLTDFYSHPQTADGLLGKCKSCAKKDVKANREAKVEQYRAYDRERCKTPESIERRKKSTKAWFAKDARRMRCHNAVHKAIRKGRLERSPCEVCGSAKSVAHHDSYDQPLVVRWLCQAHHTLRHQEMRELGLNP